MVIAPFNEGDVMTIIINRINGERELNKQVERIEISIDGVKYTLTDRCGTLRIHAHDGALIVEPACANEVCVYSKPK